MKKTRDTIAYSIIGAVRPILKQTDYIDIRDVREWVKDERNNLAKQQIDKNIPFIPKPFLQTETVAITSIEKSIKYPGLVLKKTSGMPSILTMRGGLAIDNISLRDIFADKITFLENTATLISYVNSIRFKTSSSPKMYCAIAGGELIVASNDSILLDSLENLHITAVFENPEEISTFTVNTDQYPIADSLIPMLFNKIVQEKYGISMANMQDDTNDESHSLKFKTTGQ